MSEHRLSPLEQALGIVVMLLLTAGVVIVAVGGRETVNPDRPLRPAPGFISVSGTATVVRLSATTFDPIALPARFEPLERGTATATFSDVTVDGRLQSIVWSGNAPLRLTGDAPLVIDTPIAIVANKDGVDLSITDASAHLVRGRYRLEGAVAIGSGGLGRPQDGVTFEVLDQSTVTFRGTTRLHTPPAPQHREGPGQVHIEGTLEFIRANETTQATLLELNTAPYALELSWVGNGIQVKGELSEVPSGSPATPKNSPDAMPGG